MKCDHDKVAVKKFRPNQKKEGEEKEEIIITS